jgi:hypothetical protein
MGQGDTLDVQFGAGTAHMAMSNLALQDYFDIPNAFFRFETPVAVDAKCSFDVRWSPPVTARSKVTGPPGSAGDLVMSQATMTWSATNASGFSFQSNPSPTTSVFAQLGHVRNGVFA